jgi:hypothetical protein
MKGWSYGRNPDEPDCLVGSATTEDRNFTTKLIEFKGMANFEDQVAVQRWIASAD